MRAATTDSCIPRPARDLDRRGVDRDVSDRGERVPCVWATETVDGQKEAVAEYRTALALNPLDEKSESELGKIATQNGEA